mgnify:CR=1 FL=1
MTSPSAGMVSPVCTRTISPLRRLAAGTFSIASSPVRRFAVVSVRENMYVHAAQSIGASTWRILLRHILPNLAGPVVVYLTLLVPKVILLESFLSFLGLGVQEPLTSLGVLISEGAKSIQGASYLLVFPSIVLVVMLLSLNFLGDGLRDALDPRDR